MDLIFACKQDYGIILARGRFLRKYAISHTIKSEVFGNEFYHLYV